MGKTGRSGASRVWLGVALTAALVVGAVATRTVLRDNAAPPDPCEIGYAAIHDLVAWGIAGEWNEAAWQHHAELIDAIHPGWGTFLAEAAADPLATRGDVVTILISLIDKCVPSGLEPSS